MMPTVTVKSTKMPWYKGESLLTYLENIQIHDDSIESGFTMPVQRVCRPDRTFRGFQGQIESGKIKVGDEITALPSNETKQPLTRGNNFSLQRSRRFKRLCSR